MVSTVVNELDNQSSNQMGSAFQVKIKWNQQPEFKYYGISNPSSNQLISATQVEIK